VTSATTQLSDADNHKLTGADAGTFVHVAISGSGYRSLRKASETIKMPVGAALRGRDTLLPSGITFYERDVFAKGMKNRRAVLQDPPLADWEAGLRDVIDAVVILADDDGRRLLAVEAALPNCSPPKPLSP